MPPNKIDTLANEGGRDDLSIVSASVRGLVATLAFASARSFTIVATLPDTRSYSWARVILVSPSRLRVILPPRLLARPA